MSRSNSQDNGSEREPWGYNTYPQNSFPDRDSLSHVSSSVSNEQSYPDPHEFYRLPAAPTADIVVESSNMTSASRQRPYQSSGPRPTPRVATRSASGPTTSTSALASKSSPSLPSTNRPPVRSLVDRFNQPTSASSQSRYHRPPRASLGSRTQSATSPTSRFDGGSNKLFKPKVKSQYPPALGPSVTVGGVSGVGDRQDLAAMMMRSPHRQSFYEGSTHRSHTRPSLFGEVGIHPDGAIDLTQAPVHPGERQSFFDGSMHRPNAMFPRGTHSRTRSNQDVPQITVFTDLQGSAMPAHTSPATHRKSRSEAYNHPIEPQTLNIETLAPAVDMQSPAPRQRTSPKSRIPVRSRKMSGATSDSGSSMSSRAGSSLSESRYTSVSPPKDSRLPTAPRPRAQMKTNGSASTPRPATPPQTLSSRRYGSPAKTPTTTSNGSLKAVIHAPPLPKTSPTLRNSRSRQPLSAASTAASRAKASAVENKSSSSSRTHSVEPLPSKTPTKVKRNTGLAGVNFAERRKLFETSSQESLRKPEPTLRRKKSSLSTTQGSPREASNAEIFAEQIHFAQPSAVTDPPVPEPPVAELDNTEDPEIDTAPHDPGADSHGEATEFETDDSPVMGIPGQFPVASPPMQYEESHSPQSPQDQNDQHYLDVSQKAESFDTYGEDNPPHAVHQRTLLTDIDPHARDSGYEADSRPHTQFFEDMSPDRADGESIQIMLGATPGPEEFHQHQPWEQEDHKQNHQDFYHDWRSPTSMVNGVSFLHDGDESPIDPFGRNRYHNQSLDNAIASQIAPKPETSHRMVELHNGLTVDAEAYNSLRDLLAFYQTNEVSPEMAGQIEEVVKRSISPNLAVQGQWDSREVSMTMLQEVVHEVEAAAPSFVAHNNPQDFNEMLDTPDTNEYLADYSPGPEYTGTATILTQPQRYSKEAISRAPWEQANQTAQMTSNEPWRSSEDFSAGLLRTESLDEARLQLPEIQNTGGNLGLAIKVTAADSGTPPVSVTPVQSPPLVTSRKSPHKQFSIPRRSPPTSSVYSHAPISTSFPASAPDLSLKATDEQPIPPFGTAEAPLQEQLPVATVDKESAEGKRLTKRRNLLRELLDTEDSYHIDIVILNEIYKDSSHMIMTEDDRKVLFSNSDRIRDFSYEFKESLREAIAAVYVPAISNKAWKRDSNASGEAIPEIMHLDDSRDRQTFVGATIERHLGQLEIIYGEYIKNHSHANARLAALTSNKDTAQKMKAWMDVCVEQSNALTRAWNLDALLVKPTQRVLKYPLILRSLLECTPKDHPDYDSLSRSEKELLEMSSRINENTKRAELMNQVMTKTKKQDGKTQVSTALSRAFGRRKIEFKEQVGLGTTVDDPTYDAIAQKFGGHFFQLQVVMRDVEKYLADIQVFMDACVSLVSTINEWAEIGHQGNVPRVAYPEIESKWRKYGQTIRDLAVIALPEHRAVIINSVVKPIQALWKLHDHPQVMMYKRKKKMPEFIRYRTMKDKGEKMDKKTIETGEQWEALNQTLKLELPKLYASSKKLVEAAFLNFIDIQLTWQLIWTKKLSTAAEEPRPIGQFQQDLVDLVAEFQSDFNIMPSEAAQYGICNRSVLNETANFLSPTFPIEDTDSSKRSSNRTRSVGSDKSVASLVWTPPLTTQSYNNQPPWMQQAMGDRNQQAGRWAHSASSSALPLAHPTPDMFDGGDLKTSPRHHKFRTSTGAYSSGSSTPRISQMDGSSNNLHSNSRPATGLRSESTPQAGRPSLDAYSNHHRPSTYSSNHENNWSLTNERSSSIFSSAMPMSDSPATTRPESPDSGETKDPEVLFLAASLFEFNIAHDRREGGYPYLVYVPGEVFDVLGTKGELWLARNQDDQHKKIGWIWEKHFARIVGEN